MDFFTFKNGDKMPMIGLGTWKTHKGQAYKVIRKALKIGYRLIDCSPLYGNEFEIGEAIRDEINEGTLSREDLWITSKLWNNAHLKEDVLPALQKSLSDLKLDYLDSFLIHWPIAFKKDVLFPVKGIDFLSLEEAPISDTWHMIEIALEKGLTKHIGVSNFSINKLKCLIATSKIKPEINQVELHPFLQQKELLNYCHSENIHLTAYAPLGSYDRIEELKRSSETVLLENNIINEIALKYDCSRAQILIKWAVERGTSVIPKSVNSIRLQQNFDSSSIKLTKEDMLIIDALDKDFRYLHGGYFTMEGSPYTAANLWD